MLFNTRIEESSILFRWDTPWSVWRIGLWALVKMWWNIRVHSIWETLLSLSLRIRCIFNLNQLIIRVVNNVWAPRCFLLKSFIWTAFKAVLEIRIYIHLVFSLGWVSHSHQRLQIWVLLIMSSRDSEFLLTLLQVWALIISQLLYWLAHLKTGKLAWSPRTG